MSNIDFSIYNIIIVLICLYFIVKRTHKFSRREQNQSLFKFISTIIIWGVILIFAISPEFSHLITKAFGLGENLNTLIFTGFIVVFILIFKLLNSIEKIEKDITDLVRKEALKKSNEKTSK